MFRYCVQIKILTSSIRIRNQFVLAWMGLKQARSCFVFPREFSSLFRVSRVQLGLLRSFSCGDLRWLRDVTGERPPLQSLDSWLRYGFGTALDPLRWLVWLWESSGPVSRSALRAFERAVTSSGELQEGRESEHANAPRLFNCPVWTSPKAAGPIRASVRGGAPPARLVFCKAFSMEKRITFDPCIKTFIKFTHL